MRFAKWWSRPPPDPVDPPGLSECSAHNAGLLRNHGQGDLRQFVFFVMTVSLTVAVAHPDVLSIRICLPSRGCQGAVVPVTFERRPATLL